MTKWYDCGLNDSAKIAPVDDVPEGCRHEVFVLKYNDSYKLIDGETMDEIIEWNTDRTEITIPIKELIELRHPPGKGYTWGEGEEITAKAKIDPARDVVEAIEFGNDGIPIEVLHELGITIDNKS